MRQWRAYLSVLVVCSPFGTALAQSPTAEDYFNQAGKQYVKEDKLAALKTLDRGLQAFPGDARLLKLAEELIKEQQQQQQQQAQQQQEQDQQKQQQGQKEQQQEQEQQKQNEDKAQQNEERKEQEGQRQPGRIAPQDADRILDALERKEQDTQDKVRAKLRPVRRVPIEKDW